MPVDSELRHIATRSLGELGDLVHHAGEEVGFVIEGADLLHTGFYAFVTINKGDGTYININMCHGCIVGERLDQASIRQICASADEISGNI